LGFAKNAILGGKTSGTPPTSVLTTNRPQQAASRIAIQKDSVNEVFRKIWPLHRTSLTFPGSKAPSNSTLSYKLFLSTNYFKSYILSPSPPIIKFTLLN
jgi:hypothetical protein